MAERVRLDIALEARGLAQSRARARDAVLRGAVTVNGVVAAKPGQLVEHNDKIKVEDPASRYVSRAALKLIAGLDAGGFEVAGKVCLDLGASTGGFTQVLCDRRAAKIYAVDVGHDQLHDAVRARKQVVVLEGTNCKELTRELVPEPVELVVCDISFVSVTKVLEQPLALCREGAEAVILIKPQFEVGRDNIGKGGIVRDESTIAPAVEAVLDFMSAQGWTHLQSLPSPIAGGDGNKEVVALFRRRG